jgi:hypothetical protein
VAPPPPGVCFAVSPGGAPARSRTPSGARTRPPDAITDAKPRKRALQATRAAGKSRRGRYAAHLPRPVRPQEGRGKLPSRQRFDRSARPPGRLEVGASAQSRAASPARGVTRRAACAPSRRGAARRPASLVICGVVVGSLETYGVAARACRAARDTWCARRQEAGRAADAPTRHRRRLPARPAAVHDDSRPGGTAGAGSRPARADPGPAHVGDPEGGGCRVALRERPEGTLSSRVARRPLDPLSKRALCQAKRHERQPDMLVVSRATRDNSARVVLTPPASRVHPSARAQCDRCAANAAP